MSQPNAPPATVILASFFKRLEAIEAVVRAALSQARISALLAFRGRPEKKVLMDLTKSSVRVFLDDEARAGQVSMTIEADIMHDILLDRVKPGLALGRRQLLLRGSAVALAKFLPLFNFGPMLYSEHLADIGFDGFIRRSGEAPLKEAIMSGEIFKGEPIPIIQLSLFEKVLCKSINAMAYVMGFFIGLLRYRLFERLSLFEALSAMSRGLAAAEPQQKRCVSKGEKGKLGKGEYSF